jgi:hypothetical protein
MVRSGMDVTGVGRALGDAIRIADGEDGIMGLFRKTPRPTHASRKPTGRERRAAQRTAQAEARLLETEQQIHQIADEVRGELKGSAS